MTFRQTPVSIRYRLGMLAVALLTLSACGESADSPEEALRLWLGESEAALEDGDWRELAERIALHYEDGRGNDKARLAAQLRAAVFRQGAIEVVTSVDAIELYGDDAARVDLTARFVSVGSQARGLDAGSYRVRLDLAAVDGTWQVYSARWGSSERDWR